MPFDHGSTIIATDSVSINYGWWNRQFSREFNSAMGLPAEANRHHPMRVSRPGRWPSAERYTLAGNQLGVFGDTGWPTSTTTTPSRPRPGKSTPARRW